MAISYTLTTSVFDLPYSIPDVFSEPPATVNDLFRQLSYGELSDLAAGLDGSGDVVPDRRNQVLHHANEALRNLHQKFELLRSVQDVSVPVSGQPLLVPFPVHALQVVSLLVPGGSMSFHTVPVPGEVFVFNRRISFPATSAEYSVQVTFQNRHPPLRPINQDSDLEQSIYLSAELWPALRAYIAGEIYGNMNTSDAKSTSREYRGRYVQICAEVEVRGGTPQGMMDDQKFNMRGFV